VTALFIDISKRLPASSQTAKLPDIHDLGDPGNRPKGAYLLRCNHPSFALQVFFELLPSAGGKCC
jgi:hypothetical protein